MKKKVLKIVLICFCFMIFRADYKLLENNQIIYRGMHEFSTLDPQINLSVEVGYLAMHIFDRLLEYDEHGKLYPSLLKTLPTVSSDGIEYCFILKQGVRFSNGEELKSYDVKFTFERMLCGEKNYNKSTWIFDNIKGAKDVLNGLTNQLSGFRIINDYEFKIELEKPYMPFLSGLATPYASIFPKKVCMKLGEKWGDTIVGTGPFIVTSWVKEKEIVLEKNAKYFGAKAKIDKIVNHIYSKSFANWDIVGFQDQYDKGIIDIVDIPHEKYPEYMKNVKYLNEIQTTDMLITRYITINNKNEYLKNPKVRQAISIGIAREKLCNSILEGIAIPAYTFLPKGIEGHDENAKIEYNLEKAKELLKEAGYPFGFKIKYYQLNKNDLNLDLCIQIMLNQIGINIDIETIDENQLYTLKKNGAMTMCSSSWYADIPDADNFLYNLFHSRMKRLSNYSNPLFDKLCEEIDRYLLFS